MAAAQLAWHHLSSAEGEMLTQLEKSACAATALPCSDTASPGRVGLGCA